VAPTPAVSCGVVMFTCVDAHIVREQVGSKWLRQTVATCERFDGPQSSGISVTDVVRQRVSDRSGDFASRRSPVRSRLAPLDRSAAKGSFPGYEESGRRRLRLGPGCMRGASVLAWRRCGSSLLLLAPKRQRAATHAAGEYGVSCIVRRGPCLRAGAGICAHGFRVAPYVRQQRFASHGVAEIVARLHQNEPRGRQESRGSILRTSSLTMSRQTTESAAKEWSRSGRLR
jgi:hypothetical protein